MLMTGGGVALVDVPLSVLFGRMGWGLFSVLLLLLIIILVLLLVLASFFTCFLLSCLCSKACLFQFVLLSPDLFNVWRGSPPKHWTSPMK